MRDLHRMRERAPIQVDGSKLVTLSLGLVVALAAVFSIGYVVGKRTTVLAPETLPAPIAAIDRAQDRHEQLTFYTKLSESTPVEPPPPPMPKVSVESAVQRLRQLAEAEAALAPPPAAVPAPVAPTPSESGMEGITVSTSGLDEGPALQGEYTVQVSAFRTRPEADAYAASLGRRGYKPFIVENVTPDRGRWYRVRLGRFTEENDAQRAKEELAAAAIPAWVLRAEP